MTAPQFLFAYGTLRSPVGGPSGDTRYHGQIAASICSQKSATLRGAVMHNVGDYPGVRPGDGAVVGDLFEVTSQGLVDADVVEGHPDYYRRSLEPVEVVGGEVLSAWVYWAPAEVCDGTPVITSGNWFDRRDPPR